MNMVLECIFNKCLFVAIRDNKVSDIHRILHRGIVTANATRVLDWTKGTNPDVKGEFSALTAAILVDNWECAMLLLQHGADVHYQRALTPAENAKLDTNHTRYIGPTRVERTEPPVILAILRGGRKFVKSLVQVGADVNSINRLGSSLLVLAICDTLWRNDGDLIPFLLANGADPNLTNRSGASALTAMVSFSLLQLLMQHNANIHSQTEHGVPLVIAFMQYRKVDCVLELLQRGADKNAKDEYGTSLICVAMNSKCFDVVYYLLDNGVGINTLNLQYESLLSSAMKMSQQWPGYDMFIENLRARGALESHFVPWTAPCMCGFQDDFVFPLATQLDRIVHPDDECV
jgi:ankyrin repeat protein